MDRKLDPTIAAFASAALMMGAGAMTDYVPRRPKRSARKAAQQTGSTKRAKNKAQRAARKKTRKAK